MSRDLPAGTGVAPPIPVDAPVTTGLGVHARDNSTYVLGINKLVSPAAILVNQRPVASPLTSYLLSRGEVVLGV